MKLLACFKRDQWKIFALAAAMVMNLAATAALPAMAAEQPAETTAAPESGSAAVGQEELDPKLEDLVMYRWKRVTKQDFPTDGKEYLSLLINQNGYVLCGTVYDNAVRGVDSPSLGTIAHKETIDKDHWLWTDDHADAVDNNTDENYSHYVLTSRRAGYSDLQIDVSREVFYTNDDCNGLYISYRRKTDDLSFDNQQTPMYAIGIRSTKDGSEKNYLCGDEHSSESAMHIIKSLEGWRSEWDFHPTDSYKFNVQVFDSNQDDEFLICRDGYWFCADGDREDYDDCYWYIGEKMRFAQMKGNRTIGNKQLLPVGSGELVQSDGTKSSVNGVVIPEGCSLKIDKGGILSVSGVLINNGTISNSGTILVKDGGSISPFIPSGSTAVNGCGKIVCTDGDIIVQQGGAIYAGLVDENGAQTPFRLLGHSVLINQGLVVCGGLVLGEGAAAEIYETGQIFGGYDHFTDQFTGLVIGTASSTWIQMHRRDSGYVDKMYKRTVRKQTDLLPLYTADFLAGKSNSYLTQRKSQNYYTDYKEIYGMGICREQPTDTYEVHLRCVSGYEKNIHDDLLKKNGMAIETFTL